MKEEERGGLRGSEEERKGQWGRLPEARDRSTRVSTVSLESENPDASDPVYIVPPDGRDEGTTSEDLPDRDAWRHLGLPSARRFNTPASDQATSTLSA